MEQDNKPNNNPVENSQSQAPADALSRTPDELEEDVKQSDTSQATVDPEIKKIPFFKRLFRKVNVYLLLFILVVVISAIITVVMYLNSQKEAPTPNLTSQQLTEESLKQLAKTDTSVGDKSQTLTIQGNAVISGQTLSRGDLNVAGNFQTAGNIIGPNITISGSSNIGSAQINSLQVAGTTAIQGSTTMRDLNVAGTSTFAGSMTASRITVTDLILSGNASLRIPNHISFTGPSPSRTTDNTALGNGGSASVDGSDTAGTININSGNNPAPGCFIRINFAQRFTNKPHVLVTPVGVAAGQTQFYVNRDVNGFNLCSANSAPANQAFAYDYFVTN